MSLSTKTLKKMDQKNQKSQKKKKKSSVISTWLVGWTKNAPLRVGSAVKMGLLQGVLSCSRSWEVTLHAIACPIGHPAVWFW